MGRKYAARSGPLSSTDTTTLALIRLGGSARPRIYEFEVACSSGVADATCHFAWQKTSDYFSEGTAFTPVPLDAQDPAGETIIGQGPFPVEPPYFANAFLLRFAMNQQFTVLWRATKRGQLRVAGGSAGLGFKYLASSGGAAYEVQFKWEE